MSINAKSKVDKSGPPEFTFDSSGGFEKDKVQIEDLRKSRDSMTVKTKPIINLKLDSRRSDSRAEYRGGLSARYSGSQKKLAIKRKSNLKSDRSCSTLNKS